MRLAQSQTENESNAGMLEKLLKSELAKYGAVGCILVWLTWTKTTDDRRYFEATQSSQSVILNIVRDNTRALSDNAKAIEELTRIISREYRGDR